jgi:UDP-N-acetylglucosamine 1-carboxyvinyltransferase
MDKFLIDKSGPLTGRTTAGGAKNSCLALMAAALLTDEPVILENTPNLVDVRTMSKVLENLGVRVSQETGSIRLDASRAEGYNAPYDMVRTMRASYYVLGPLTARKGKAEVSLPGGCAIGQRPIDLHLKGLSMLGAEITTSRGFIFTRADKLRGSVIDISGPRGSSVGATINVLLAATLAKGVTVLEGAAREPEVEDLAAMLGKMGAKIEGAGTDRIIVRGVSELGGAAHRVIPDRIETGTFAVASAITRGDVTIQDCCPEHLKTVLDLLECAGVRVEISEQTLRVRAGDGLSAFRLRTEPYPGFPTDLQAQFCALATQAEGKSQIEETIFENRFLHVPELIRLGGDIKILGSRLIVSGPTALYSAPVMASDLRASAALVLAALVADGTSEINRIYHLDRGYENLEVKLTRLGAKIVRVSSAA